MAVTCPRCYATYHQAVRFCGLCGAEIPAPAETIQTFPDPLIGQVVSDRYRLVALLGRGGMGAVYRAEHVAIGKPVALKILHGTLGQRKEVLQRFRREAEAASKLMHIHTVQVFDYGHWRGLTYLVMEYLRGADLASVIRQEGRLPWHRTMSIVAQVCDSLAEAHAMGIVHRDLKPENILLVPRAGHPDFVKVVDFGLAKIRDDKQALDTTGDGSLLGTPFYMSPEQIRGEQVDARADVYAIGGVIYRCLTGLPPFEAPTPFAVLTKHLNESLTLPGKRVPGAGIPPAVDSLVAKAMAKDAAQRFRGAAELRLAVNEVVASLTSPGTTPSLVPAASELSDPSLITFPVREAAEGREGTEGGAGRLAAEALRTQRDTERRESGPGEGERPGAGKRREPEGDPGVAQGAAPALPPVGSGPSAIRIASLAPAAGTGLDLSRGEFERYLLRLKVRRWIVWSFLLLLLLGGGAAAFVVPRMLEEPAGLLTEEEESNNGPTIANRIGFEANVRGTIGRRISSAQGDEDWYRVEIRPMRKGVLRADLSGIPGLDLRLDLFDVSGGEPMAAGERGGPGAGEAIPGVLVDGMVYFVRVRENLPPKAVPSERISDQYRVTVRHLPADAFEAEPNDDPATAQAVAPGASMTGYLEVPGDRDIYCVATQGGGAPKVVVTPPAGLDVALETAGQTLDAAGPGAAETTTLGPADPCLVVLLSARATAEGKAAVGPEQAYNLHVE
ncbi:MAG: serine/threonine protein kinase [Deltaproteobacteria bacterium]|nr:serine/threonine protein kinase [Deltaproteobacteria bacterium]